MKVVIYHTNGPKSNEYVCGIYEHLILGLKENVNSLGYPLVHLTLKGFVGLGDENYYYDGDPSEVIYNREKCVLEFLRSVPDDQTVYWFTEPDSRIQSAIPELTTDLALLIRQDTIPITPAWRLCKKTALPFFEEAFSYFDLNNKTWSGDAYGYLKMWESMGKPTSSLVYKNVSIDLRKYKNYCSQKGKYTTQHKGANKYKICNTEFLEKNIKEREDKHGV
jgi:hypothetical protein